MSDQNEDTYNPTTIELLDNATTWVGDHEIFVMSSSDGTIDLGVSGGGADVPLHRYREGQHIPIGEDNWAILEIIETDGYEDGALPGVSKKKVVARIRRMPRREE